MEAEHSGDLKQHLPFMRPYVIICKLCLFIYCTGHAGNKHLAPLCLFLFFLSSSCCLFSFPSWLILLFSYIRQSFNGYIKEWGHYEKDSKTPDVADIIAQMLSSPLRCYLYPSGSFKSPKNDAEAGLHDIRHMVKLPGVGSYCPYNPEDTFYSYVWGDIIHRINTYIRQSRVKSDGGWTTHTWPSCCQGDADHVSSTCVVQWLFFGTVDLCSYSTFFFVRLCDSNSSSSWYASLQQHTTAKHQCHTFRDNRWSHKK